VDLVLVGDGEDTAACRAWAERMGGRAILAGQKGMDEVAPYYAAADVATLPSHAEGTPNCVIEALACGRPVVASRVGGIPDMIHDPSMGELVPPQDAPALSRAFARALSRTYDPEQIVRLTGRGSWEDSARSLAELLAGAVRR
jgi:glycosyltransferase involved in cell wall biosynthesis